MSLMSLESTDVSGSESKRYKMKQFIDAAKEYSQSKSENTAMIINRLLQVRKIKHVFSLNNEQFLGIKCDNRSKHVRSKY